MKQANYTLDVHLLRNDTDLPMYVLLEEHKLIDKPYMVRLVDAGVIKTDDLDNGTAPVDKLIVKFSEIDDIAGPDGNPRKCEL